MRQEITLEKLQRIIDKWVKDYGVRYFSELTNLAVLMEEVGELARIMSRAYGDQSFKAEESDQDLADELADVLFVLICIANQTGTDLTAAIQTNLEKKTQRDKDRHHRNPKLKRRDRRKINGAYDETTGEDKKGSHRSHEGERYG